MNDFFDFREFILSIVKKLKFIFIIAVACSIVLGALKIFPGVAELNRYNSAGEDANTQSVLPYNYVGQNVVNLQGSKVSVADFVAYGKDVNLVAQLKEKYFENFKSIYSDYQRRLVKYKYRTNEEFDKEINDKTFQDSFSVGKTSDSLCTITVNTPNRELTESILKDYTDSLFKLVTDKLGKFNYKLDKVETKYSLPGATAGLKPTTVEPKLDNNGIRSVRDLIVKVGKSMIKGALIGVAAAVLLIFFFYAISKYINSYKDLRQWDLLYLGSIRMSERKPSKLPFVNKIMNELYQDDKHFEMIKSSITNKINMMDKTIDKVFLTGTVGKESVVDVQQAVKPILEKEITVKSFPSVIDEKISSEDLKSVDNVILVEKIEYSKKLDIDLQVQTLKDMGKEILGCILIVE